MKKLGLIGCGKWGKNLARNFHHLKVLHTICDAALDNTPFSEIPLVQESKDLFSNPEISQIAIATPPNSHFELAKQALLFGKDIFVEKPLCFSSNEARVLLELANKKELIIMAGHLLHYHPCIQRIKEIIAADEIGKICYLSSHRLGPNFIRRENALWDLVPHDVSIILSLCDNKTPSITSCTTSQLLNDEVADTVMASFEYEDKTKAHIRASWAYPFKEQKLTIIGRKGSLVFDDTKPWHEKLTHFKLQDSILNERGQVSYEKKSIELPLQEPLLNECEHFVNCCKMRTQPLTSIFEAFNVIKVLEKMQELCFERGTIKSAELIEKNHL